ncbi:MAG: hypothetical protein IOC63_01080 [Methylobacterium sp.]|jgi:hypothetical protein|nr:hypothetical protein [Methylobacterium sp.]
MKIAIAGSEIIDRGHAYVPQMRALVGNNLIASPGARAVIRRRSGAEEVLLHRRRDFGVWAMTAGLVFEVVIGFDDIGPAQVARYEVHPFVEHLLDDGSSELVALGDYEGRKAADLRALFAAIFPS